MRVRDMMLVGAVASLQWIALPMTAAHAEREERGGPLPLLGVTALGQGLTGLAGAALVWRRRLRNRNKQR